MRTGETQAVLRKKLAELECGVGIKVKRGIGYMLEVLS